MVEKIYNANGIKVCTALNTNLKSFCLSLYVRAGSLFENRQNNGISHLFEHVVFRNLKGKYKDFYELLAVNGIYFNGCTYKEFIRFTINGPHASFDFASQILCGIFDDICISKTELDNEKKRIKAEMREEDERASLDFYFNKLVWKNTQAENTSLGYCRALDSISVKKLTGFKKEFLTKANCFVYVTGNASQENVDELIKKVSALDIQEGVSKTNTVTVSDEFFHRNGVVNVKDGYWYYIKIGFDVNSSYCSNCVADLLYDVLFVGDKALIHKYLSEENSIIYSYDSALERYDNVGNINFKFEIEKNKIETAIKIIVKLLNDVKAGNFNFEASLKSELYSAELELDAPDDLNFSMAYYNHILNTSPIDYSDEYYGRFKVTKQQVVDAANQIFRGCNMTVAIKGNKRRINVENISSILTALDN